MSTGRGNTYQFGVRGSATYRVVNEVVAIDNQRLENKIIELTSLVRQLAIGQYHISPLAKVCGICTSTEHPIDACPTLQETEPNSAEVVGLISGQQYGLRAVLKPEIRFDAKHTLEPTKIPTTSPQISRTPIQTIKQPVPQNNSSPSFEDLVKQLATSNIQFQQNVTATIQDLQTHIRQLATTINQLQSNGYGHLPSQTIANLKGNVSTISLKSDMKDEPSSKGSTLILGRLFLRTTRTKIDVHAGILSMELGDNMVQFNIFEAMKHPIENHFVFGLDMIDVLVDDYMQLHTALFAFSDFAEMANVSDFADLADFECTCDGGKECSICAKICVTIETGQEVAKVVRRLNPTILDVIKKEVMKLLAEGIIYLISDSQWVSLVQVVPKKSGMTIMKNQNDELVPTKIQNS
ncbi:hypothetical protein CR513_26002, partial [Mucuna pruriens]